MTPFQQSSRKEFEENSAALKKRDWNKDWPSATREAPNTCTSCDKKLEKPSSKGKLLIAPCNEFPCGLVSTSDTQWRIDCKCGVCYIWSHPNVWKRTHRFSELHMFVQEDGSLLRPFKIL